MVTIASEPLVSILVPLYNEAASLPLLVEGLCHVAESLEDPVEFVLVDDGSCDETPELLDELCREDARFDVVELLTNYGQVAALSAGMCYARGDVVVTLDGDLQNDPAGIPELLRHLAAGHDLVGGVRVERRDGWHRRLVARLVRVLTHRLTGVEIRDLGCSLKAYHRDVVEMLRDRDGVVRFNTVAAFKRARAPREIPVDHAPRRHGQSKWGLLAKVEFLVDLLAVSAARPLSLVMLAGFGASLFGIGLYLLYFLGLTTGVLAMSAPAGILLHGLGIGLMGLAGHVVVRILEASTGDPLFRVKRVRPAERSLAPGLPSAALPLYGLKTSERKEETWCQHTA